VEEADGDGEKKSDGFFKTTKTVRGEGWNARLNNACKSRFIGEVKESLERGIAAIYRKILLTNELIWVEHRSHMRRRKGRAEGF